VDLAKVGEVWEQTVGIGNLTSGITEVNKRLGEGWVLISARGMDKNTSLYILGKPRNVPSQTQRDARREFEKLEDEQHAHTRNGS
jgi:hypothetical protein